MSKDKLRNPEAIKNRLVELLSEGKMLPGSISEQWNVCGMPNCRCKDPKSPRKHGPYHQLSFTLAGKSTSMFIKDDELERVRSATKRYHQFKELSLKLVQAYVAQARAERKTRQRTRGRK